MKKILFIIISCIFISIAVPLLIVALMGGLIDNTKGDDELISVYFHTEDKVKKINLSEYLTGVVCAEMNAVFDEEALKAQAVAARTYTMYKISHPSDDDYHKNALICTDHTHCQAWEEINEKAEVWGDSAAANTEKIKNAVSSTANEIITYNGEVINALFHSTSSGMTESAEDIWGKAVPYLVSVKSDGEEKSPRFESREVFSKEDFLNRAKEHIEGADLSAELFSDIERSQAGGIKKLKVCGIEITGSQLRTIYNLRSTNAQISTDGNNVTFDVKGNGHGVGMSQYGANHLAQSGKSYKEILEHYYSGVQISKSNSIK